MRTSYRDIALLACCQGLLLVNTSGLTAMSGLVGYALVADKTYATLALTTYVIGSACAAMPASPAAFSGRPPAIWPRTCCRCIFSVPSSC